MSFNSVTQGGGFVGCTLVRTKEGLVPIEKIKVGDWVLSKPDQGGEQAYKRVVKTFRHEDEPVMLLRYEAAHDENILQSLFVTANHPFWVPGMGWKSANYLEGGVDVELTDGTAAPVLCSVQLYRSTEENVGWVQCAWGGDPDPDGRCERVDFRNGSISVGESRSGWPDPPEWAADWEQMEYRTAVYNIEVEDYHTYYVGETVQAWVHSACSAQWRRVPKCDAVGIHGILFYELPEKKAYYPSRRDEDAANPDGTRLR